MKKRQMRRKIQKKNAKDERKLSHDRHLSFPFGFRLWGLSQRAASAINSFEAEAIIFAAERRPWVPRAVTLERTNYSQIAATDLFWLGPRGRLRIPRSYEQNWTGAETNCHSVCRIFDVLKRSTWEYWISMMYTWFEPRIFVTIQKHNKYLCTKFLCTLNIIKWINS